MLHLLPEIERLATGERDQDGAADITVMRKYRPPANGSHTARSAWSERQVRDERQLREDVLFAIRTECQVLKSVMEEGFRSLQVSQKEALQQCMHTTTAVTSGSRRQVATSMANSRSSSASSIELVGGPHLLEASQNGMLATLPGANVNDHGNNGAPRRLSGDNLHASDKGSLHHHGGPDFKQKADRMAERGHGGHELADASGWGKQIEDDSKKESLFHKGVDFCRFGQRDQILKIVKSRPFEFIVSMLIVGNAVFMGIKANVQLSAAKEGGVDDNVLLTVFERFFTIIFALEWALRFLAYQKWFLRVEDWKWHLFDTFLVGASVVELAMEAGRTSGGAGTLVLRVLRIVKLVRLLRIARYVSAFRELRLMINGLFSSVRSLLWSFVLLSLVVYIFAIVFSQAAISFLQNYSLSGDPPGSRDEFIEFFGSTQLSMRTLLVSISGGADWVTFVYLLEKVDTVYALLFILYIMVVFHGVLHVIASIFVDSAMNTSTKEKDQMIREEMAAKDSYMSQIKSLLEDADSNKSGTVSWEEFQQQLKDAKLQEFLKSIELDVTEARGLFKLIDLDESDEVPIEEFVTGCFRLKGGHKSVDLASIMHENKKMMRVLMQFMSYAQEQFETVLDCLSRAGIAHRANS